MVSRLMKFLFYFAFVAITLFSLFNYVHPYPSHPALIPFPHLNMRTVVTRQIHVSTLGWFSLLIVT